MIRKIERTDREAYLKMAWDFYHSDAVEHPVPKEFLERTFDELMRSDAYAEGLILEYEGHTAGYGLLAKTFSREAGGMVCWIEELYVKPEFRSHGLGREVFARLENAGYARLRLEVEPENVRAVRLYERMGYRILPYQQMIRGN